MTLQQGGSLDLAHRQLSGGVPPTGHGGLGTGTNALEIVCWAWGQLWQLLLLALTGRVSRWGRFVFS